MRIGVVLRHDSARGARLSMLQMLAAFASSGWRVRRVSEPDEAFMRFWAKYRRHVAKADALKAWAKLDPDEALVLEMLDALEWQFRGSDVEFIPYPATWLNGRRWEDEPPQGKVSRLTPFEMARRAGLK